MKFSSRFRFHSDRVGPTLSLPMQLSTRTIDAALSRRSGLAAVSVAG
jgi:hypothetical protein